MSLPAGTEVGPYEIIGPLGSGGMGEVYRARDLRLARDVAIKVLPQDFSGDPDRVARFQREAQVLASLNHPHIAAIYGIEEIDGASHFLVLELVEGETVAGALRAGPFAPGRALAVARQIADALEAAHAKGIVHRDLKPANIGLTADGVVKVLDFGIAKTLSAEDRDAAPTVAGVTRDGVVVGTAAYMSPEQARGLPIDKRTDIWAFGCLLYEMLSGRRAFDGQTTSDVMVAVLERQPEWTALPSTTSPRIQSLLKRCLAKDSKQRLHDIADARIEIDEALSQPDVPTALTGRVSRRERVAWAVAAASLLALTVSVAWNRTASRDAPAAALPTHTSSIVLPDYLRLAGPSAGRFALSPDGRQLAIVAVDSSGTSRLYIRRLDSRAAQPLAGTEDAAFPFWSPDSRFVAFLAQSKLKKIAVIGGDVVTLADAAFGATGAWNQNDVILFTPRGNAPLFRVSASSGTPMEATTLVDETGDVQHSFPFFLPDGRHFLFFVVGGKAGQIDPRGVYLGSLDRDVPIRPLVEGATNAQYANGHLIFLRGGVLFAQPFDVERLQLHGEARTLVTQVQTLDRSVSDVTGAFTLSQTGLLAYQSTSRFLTQLTWFDRQGNRLSTVGERGDYTDVSLARDGSRVVTSVMDPAVATRDLWTFDVAREVGERLTFGPEDDFGPNWSADGSRIFFSSRRGGGIHLFEKPSRGSMAETLVREDDLGKFNPHPSPDGQHLVYVAGGGIIARSDIWVASRSADASTKPFLETPFIESQPQFSPDGRWVAFMSNKSGRPEVYVTSFPLGESETLVSAAGGSLPRWSRNTREIFYLAPDGMLTVVDVQLSGERLEIGPPRRLFAIRSRPGRLDAFPYDLSPAGDRILVNAFVEEQSPPITLIVNWRATE
jgi:serine/threonine protein kinase/Tol biopolymer transport system component